MTIDKIINTIICGDCLEVMKDWPADTFDGIVTDPPYGLGFMGKDWDTFKDAEKSQRVGEFYTTRNIGGQKVRHTKGWSAASAAGLYDHSRNAEFQQWFTVWAAECLRIAKPGAIMLCFGGTRTYHRLTCAIEDAGWQIRDCVGWFYGSGFPKSLNIGKKLEGWDGYGTALKPAWEPIVVAMKPLDGTFAHNAEKWGVAGLNIDGGRIGLDGEKQPTGSGKNNAFRRMEGRNDKWIGGKTQTPPQGRWPANVILDEEVGAMLDEQAPLTGAFAKVKSGHNGKSKGIYHDYAQKGDDGLTFYDDGLQGASRFFYCAKASRSERNAGLDCDPQITDDGQKKKIDNAYLRGKTLRQNNHPTVKPLKLMEYLCHLLKPPSEHPILLDPFTGSGTTLMAAINTGWDYVGIEKEKEYCLIADKRIAWAKKQRQGQRSLFEREGKK